MYLVSPGYNITFNATEYEFDVDVYSSVGTFVFDALLIAENLIDIVVIRVNLAGNAGSFDPYSINGMNTGVDFFPNEMSENPLLTVTLDEVLDPNDDTMDYYFNIDYEATSSPAEGTPAVYTGSANVILHEIGKL